MLWGVVRHFLDQKWSPQEISATLKRAFPDQPDLNVSHETIYNAIYAYPRGELRRQLIACLRQGHTKRLPRSRGTDRRGQIPDMVSIHVRPPGSTTGSCPALGGRPHQGAGNQSAKAYWSSA